MRDLKTAILTVPNSYEITPISTDLLKNCGSTAEHDRATWENHLLAQAWRILTTARSTAPSATDISQNARFITILKHTSESQP
jgi:hypothetical protein